MNVAMAYPTQRHQLLSKFLHASGGSAQHHGLKAMRMIQMNMRAGDDQIMMLVLQLRYTLASGAVMVVIDITDACHTPFCLVLFQRNTAKLSANEIAHSLGAVAVSVFDYERIELPGKLVVQRNRESLHETSGMKFELACKAGSGLRVMAIAQRSVMMRRSKMRSSIQIRATSAINREPPCIRPRR